jgi:hypothetical protein
MVLDWAPGETVLIGRIGARGREITARRRLGGLTLLQRADHPT